MQVTSSTPGVMTTHGTQSTAPIKLPYERRYEAIHYENADGTVGVRAYPVNYEQLYNLKGRLLTLIDATYTDAEQRKAQKDVVWNTLRAWMDDIERAGGYDVVDGIPTTAMRPSDPPAQTPREAR